MEFGVKSLPGTIYLITGTYRYCSIRHMAQSTVRLSVFFKAKVGLSFVMALTCLAYLIAAYTIP